MKNFFSNKSSSSRYSFSKSEILDMAKRGDIYSLLLASLSMEDKKLSSMLLMKITTNQIPIFVQMLPENLVLNLLDILNDLLETDLSFERICTWLKNLILYHSESFSSLAAKTSLKQTKKWLIRRADIVKSELSEIEFSVDWLID